MVCPYARSIDICKVLYLIMLIKVSVCYDETCDRRPLGTKTAPLPPDNRFKIDIEGVGDKYIPQKQYKVKLFSRDGVSTFIAFTISVREDSKYNDKNPRKPIPLNSGVIIPSADYNVMSSPHCNNTVIQSDITPKTYIETTWIAPPKENKCVTIYAVIAVKPDVWYSYEGPLSKRVCEDRRKADDMQPPENDDCRVCEEARYQLTFEGMWSYNTHPLMFPASNDLARFSDVVGASHNKNFNVYKFNSEASEGLKMLAEQGNTTKLELEIQEELGSNVRTVIKATGQPKPNMSTRAIFRVSREHHLVSLVSAIIPSPDWFLGVANFELCEVSTGKWTQSARFNLYPMDAGTDSGLTFESPNEDTSPPQPISSAVIAKDIPKEQLRPFARMQFDLIRTYSIPGCSTEEPMTSTGGTDVEETTTETTTTSEEPPTPDVNSSAECPMTAWEDWLPCEGMCVDQKLTGFQMRFRYHLVDGVAVGKYVESGGNNDKEVPQYCLDKYEVSQTRECEDECQEVTAQRRIWSHPVSPGEPWGRTK